MDACESGHEAVARLLLSRGANQALQCNGGRTPLHWAVSGEHPEILALLCAAPGAAAALELVDETSFTPLSAAVELGYAACEAVLRAHGAPM